jgi:hypothetical protein
MILPNGGNHPHSRVDQWRRDARPSPVWRRSAGRARAPDTSSLPWSGPGPLLHAYVGTVLILTANEVAHRPAPPWSSRRVPHVRTRPRRSRSWRLRILRHIGRPEQVAGRKSRAGSCPERQEGWPPGGDRVGPHDDAARLSSPAAELAASGVGEILSGSVSAQPSPVPIAAQMRDVPPAKTSAPSQTPTTRSAPGSRVRPGSPGRAPPWTATSQAVRDAVGDDQPSAGPVTAGGHPGGPWSGGPRSGGLSIELVFNGEFARNKNLKTGY